MFSCQFCQKTFNTKKSLDGHVAGKHSRSTTGKNTKKYQLYCTCVICKKAMTTQTINRHFIAAHTDGHKNGRKHKILTEKTCPKCNAIHNKNGIYCSYKCSNGRIHSEITKDKISKSVTTTAYYNKQYKPPYCKVKICKYCNRYFELAKKSDRISCSEQCKHLLISAGSKKSVAKQMRRSKDEIALYELCRDYFNHVEHNIPMFNGWDADIIIHDFQIAIMWNGPWHYRNMNFGNHSLSQVQTRDRIKIDTIESFGWKVLVFEDRYYSPQTAFSHILREIDHFSTPQY